MVKVTGKKVKIIDETAAGVFTIAVTPFLPDEAVDWNNVDRMVDFYISKGATVLTILGMMGEAGKLTAEESLTIVERVVARSLVSTIVGVSAAGFAAMKTLADAAMDAAALGVMVAHHRIFAQMIRSLHIITM